MSVDPDAVIFVDAALSHAEEPPLTFGTLGAVWSSRTVFAAPDVAGAHAETLPAASTARNCTSVSPSFGTLSDPGPGELAGVQVVPPSVEVRDS